jgi:hypothetical protein
MMPRSARFTKISRILRSRLSLSGEAGAPGAVLHRGCELVEGRAGGFGAGGDHDVIAGYKRERVDDRAEAAAYSIADHCVADSLSDGVAESIVRERVGAGANGEQAMLRSTSILQHRDEVLAPAEPIGPSW